MVQIEKPAPIEQAAMATAAETASEGAAISPTDGSAAPPKKKKRTKAEIRKATFARIRKEFRPFMKQLEAISQCENYSEERIRLWCVDVLRKVLGYDEADLDLELSAVGKRIDVAIKH